MPSLKLKRIYQEADKENGLRILVDGLWPRGIRKDNSLIDLWLKDIAPSADLRRWFNHEPEKWEEFCKRYHKELHLKRGPVQKLLNALKEHDVILLFAAKDERYNNAVALKEYLDTVK